MLHELKSQRDQRGSILPENITLSEDYFLSISLFLRIVFVCYLSEYITLSEDNTFFVSAFIPPSTSG